MRSEVVLPEGLSAEAWKASEYVRQADIVVGIPSYNNGRTIAHVVRAVHVGLAKYFPQLTAVIVNSDGGSTDRTREAVLSAHIDDPHLLLLSTPTTAAHRLSFPYHGIPGKGSAFRLVFEIAARLGFADASSFYKAFRKWSGSNPGHYRTLILNEVV